MKRVTGFIIFITMLASIAVAQPKIETGVTFSAGFPLGAFKDNVDHTGLGVSWDFTYRLSNSPFAIGASLGFLTYGSRSQDVILSPGVVVGADISNNILLTHFIFRYQPPVGHKSVRPFVEGLLGFNYLWTQTSVGSGYNQITSTNFSDSALSAGVGGGISLRLRAGGMKDLGPAYSIDLVLGARFLFGGEAEYLTEGGIKTKGDLVIYDVNRSNTNLLMTDVGVTFTF